MPKKPGEKPDPDDDNAETFSAEQREEITKVINAAVGAHFTRKLPQMIKESLDGALTGLREELKGGKGADGEKPKGGAGEPSESEKALKAQLEDLQKKMKAMSDDTAKEKARAVEKTRDATIQEALVAAGVDKNRLKGAVAVVRDAVKVGEDGAFTWKAKRDGYEDDLDVAAGIKEWVATDEGKAYLGAPTQTPPRGGSGTQPRRPAASRVINGGGGAPQPSPGAAKAEKRAAAMDKLAEQVGSLLTNGGGSVDVT